MVGEAARVGKLFTNMAAGVIHEQAVEDIGGLACCSGDHLDRKRCILIRDVARVSKADGSQSLDLQHDALRAAGVERTISMMISYRAAAMIALG